LFHLEYDFEAVQEVYQYFAPDLAKDDYKLPPVPHENEVPDKTGELEQTLLFGKVTVRKYRWDAAYDAESYIEF
jgi:hypothetical protein